MKAISLILCFLLPHAIVGSVFIQQGTPMVNQRSLDFIDQYPNEITNEETVNSAPAEYKNGEVVNSKEYVETYSKPSSEDLIKLIFEINNEDQSRSSESQNPQSMTSQSPPDVKNNEDLSRTNSETKNMKSSQETTQNEMQRSQGYEIKNEDETQNSESEYRPASLEAEVKYVTFIPEGDIFNSYETQKESNAESLKSELRNSESKYKVSQEKPRSKMYKSMSQYKTQQEKGFRSSSNSEDQPQEYKYNSQKPSNNKSKRQNDADQISESRQQSSERVKPDSRSSYEYRNSAAQPRKPQSNVERQLEEFGTQQSEYQSSEYQRPEERNFEYQQLAQEGSKRYQAQKSAKLYKKTKYGKQYNQKQSRVKSSDMRDESQSEETKNGPKRVPEYYKPYTMDYTRQPMIQMRPNDKYNSVQPRIEYMAPSQVYVNSQYPAIEPDAFMNWMRNHPMLNFLRNHAMEAIDGNTEKWRQFYIPESNTESPDEDTKAKDIERIYEGLKEQEKKKGSLLNATELIRKNNQAEEHTVKTDDGYILTMFRIVPSMPDMKRPPVLLMHGQFGSADDWLLMGRERSLAYLLAQAGHEVWLGNVRGSKYARRHVSKHQAQPDFWQFSNDEVALHDLPAMIDYALNVSKHERVVYVGYGQASNDFFALASTRPEYNVKVISMFALSPMVYMTNTRSPLLKLITPSSDIMEEQLGEGQFDLSKSVLQAAGTRMCENIIGSKILCSNMRFIMSGVNMRQIDADMAAVVASYTDAGASMRQMRQLGQAVESQEYRMYDFGAYMNRQVYGSSLPPAYPLRRVSVPVELYYGAEDWLVAEADVARLREALPRAAAHALPDFTSTDMLFGKMAPVALYKKLVDSIVKINSNLY